MLRRHTLVDQDVKKNMMSCNGNVFRNPGPMLRESNIKASTEIIKRSILTDRDCLESEHG